MKDMLIMQEKFVKVENKIFDIKILINNEIIEL